MLSFISNVLSRPTRHEPWSGPLHWQEPRRQKSSWEIERDLAEVRDREIRRPGLF